MHQEGEIKVGLSIPFTVIVKDDAMGSAEKVYTIHIYKLFVSAHIAYSSNDGQILCGRLRGLTH